MATTLLAIDDSVTMRKVLELTFAGEDYRVVTAESGDAALAKLRAERPSVVLCDVTLDGPGGYALCAKIKADHPGVAVVLLASKQQPYDAPKGQSARADFEDHGRKFPRSVIILLHGIDDALAGGEIDRAAAGD